jgi:hypothetical protein
MRRTYKMLVGRSEVKEPLENLGIDGRITKLILEKWDAIIWSGRMWLRARRGFGFLGDTVYCLSFH